jgi:hypothetical protein
VQQSSRHLDQDAGHAAGPFLAKGRTGCCQGAGRRDAEQQDLEHREVHQWNQDVAAAGQPGPRRPERRAPRDLARVARLGVEPAFSVSEPAAELSALLAAAQPVPKVQTVPQLLVPQLLVPQLLVPQLLVRQARSAPTPRRVPRQELVGLPPPHRRPPPS